MDEYKVAEKRGGTHRLGGLTASGADVPSEMVKRRLGSDEVEELGRITWP